MVEKPGVSPHCLYRDSLTLMNRMHYFHNKLLSSLPSLFRTIPPGQLPPGQLPPGQLPLDNCHLGNFPPDNCHLGQLSPGQFPPRTIAETIFLIDPLTTDNALILIILFSFMFPFTLNVVP